MDWYNHNNKVQKWLRGEGKDADRMDGSWRIELFGGVRAQLGDLTIARFANRKAASLLAYLALNADRPHPREILAELLWTDEDAETTRDRFRQVLAALRRILEPEGVSPGSVLSTDRAEVHLLSQRLITDVADFEAALQNAEHASSLEVSAEALKRALDLYRGELLPGYYEEWIAPVRERLAERHRDALNRLSKVLEQQGNSQEALEMARRTVDADPLREDAHANLMRLYAEAGRLPDALRQYRELERTLKEQVNGVPSPATQGLLARLRAGVAAAPISSADPLPSTPISLIALEPEGGAVPLDSRFYIVRPIDGSFEIAIERQDSIVLVKGARQMGKTSLLARGLQRARASGAKVVLTDLQKLTNAQMETADALFFNLAEMIAEQLEIEIDLEALWNTSRSWNVKFERFLRREVLEKTHPHVVWGLDEIDRLFGKPFCTEVFGMFRSWHNARSLSPEGPWAHLTLAIAYATEAHLFITDLNQSPFNVGTRLALDDFSEAEVSELNQRYGSRLKTDSDLARFFALVGGNPYLVRRGLNAMAADSIEIEALEAQAQDEDGVFSDPLRRMVNALSLDPTLRDELRELLDGGKISAEASFYRLRSAGIVTGRSAQDAQIRCRLYADYLRRHLE